MYWMDEIIAAAVACLSTLEFPKLCVLTAGEERRAWESKSLGRVQRVRGVDHFNFPRTSHNICVTMEIIGTSLSIQYLLMKSSDEL